MILLAWRGRACADVKPDLAAKWIAVATGVAPCVHGVMPIVAAKFKRR